jgi:hypothetical protein
MLDLGFSLFPAPVPPCPALGVPSFSKSMASDSISSYHIVDKQWGSKDWLGAGVEKICTVFALHTVVRIDARSSASNR